MENAVVWIQIINIMDVTNLNATMENGSVFLREAAAMKDVRKRIYNE